MRNLFIERSYSQALRGVLSYFLCEDSDSLAPERTSDGFVATVRESWKGYEAQAEGGVS